jgi:predicted ArsR family transcriptional regulator
MDIMLAEGLVESRLARQGRGRPGLVYSLSVDGEERTAAANYARLLERLYPALESLPLAEVSGASGEAVVRRLFEVVAEGVASEYSAHVTASDLPGRVEQVAEALSGEGILTAVVDEGDVYRLVNVGCPYRSTATENHACCEADRRAIELLLDVPVVQTARAVEGASMCEYVVRKAQVSPFEARGAQPLRDERTTPPAGAGVTGEGDAAGL